VAAEPARLPAELAAPADTPAAAPAAKRAILPTLVGLILATLLAAGAGGGLGVYLADTLEQIVAERMEAERRPDLDPATLKYSGEMELWPLEPVVANLAEPSGVWVRIEAAMVYEKDALTEPHVVAAEIEQDLLAYFRTVRLAQLEGASALPHLREDLNERASVRTRGLITELIIKTVVVQ
jgi:flagellar FliL protein